MTGISSDEIENIAKSRQCYSSEYKSFSRGRTFFLFLLQGWAGTRTPCKELICDQRVVGLKVKQGASEAIATAELNGSNELRFGRPGVTLEEACGQGERRDSKRVCIILARLGKGL